MAAIINHLLWDEDFSSYANEAALAAAYPGTDTWQRYVDEGSIDFSATAGPDGQPGIKDQVSSPSRDTGAISRGDLAPTCYGFRLKARWNFAAPNALLSVHEVTTLQYVSPTVELGIVNLTRAHSTGTLRLSIRTVSPYGNLSGNTVDYHEFPGVAPTNVPVTVEVSGRLSTIGGSAGAWVPDTDGEVNLIINGTTIYTFTGPVWNGDATFNPSPYWTYANFQTLGALSDIEVWDETGCTPVPPNPNPPNCECTPPIGPPKPPGTLPPPITHPPPLEPTIGEQLACLGGGVVLTQADFVPVELWWAA